MWFNCTVKVNITGLQLQTSDEKLGFSQMQRQWIISMQKPSVLFTIQVSSDYQLRWSAQNVRFWGRLQFYLFQSAFPRRNKTSLHLFHNSVCQHNSIVSNIQPYLLAINYSLHYLFVIVHPNSLNIYTISKTSALYNTGYRIEINRKYYRIGLFLLISYL